MAQATKAGPGAKRPLRLVEEKKGAGVTCANLDEVVCPTAADCLAALRRGAASRQCAATKCNDKSSRSHALYTLKVCVRSLTEDGRDLVVNGQLNLVDLAGSECVGRSGATDRRAREAGSINQSLLTLGRVITALVNPGESKYVPRVRRADSSSRNRGGAAGAPWVFRGDDAAAATWIVRGEESRR